jgi:hypothetical protein
VFHLFHLVFDLCRKFVYLLHFIERVLCRLHEHLSITDGAAVCQSSRAEMAGNVVVQRVWPEGSRDWLLIASGANHRSRVSGAFAQKNIPDHRA